MFLNYIIFKWIFFLKKKPNFIFQFIQFYSFIFHKIIFYMYIKFNFCCRMPMINEKWRQICNQRRANQKRRRQVPFATMIYSLNCHKFEKVQFVYAQVLFECFFYRVYLTVFLNIEKMPFFVFCFVSFRHTRRWRLWNSPRQRMVIVAYVVWWRSAYRKRSDFKRYFDVFYI